MEGSTSGHCAALPLGAPMSALSHVKFGLSFGCRYRQVAKRADGIYRFIWIDAVEELVEVHIFPCTIGPHQRIPKYTSCTA
jgi:hypothetical protein